MKEGEPMDWIPIFGAIDEEEEEDEEAEERARQEELERRNQEAARRAGPSTTLLAGRSGPSHQEIGHAEPNDEEA